jgi:diguanylate cyclase (GGDEF)-like protein
LKTRFKAVISAIMPFVLLILAYISLMKTSSMSKPQLDIIKLSPYAVFLIGSAIAWKFNRSREMFILFVLAVCFAAVTRLPSHTGLQVQANDLYTIIGAVIPLNIAVFSFFKERGFLSLWGLLRFGFILSQFILAGWLMQPTRRESLNLLHKDLLPVDLHSVTSISQVPLAISLTALIILVARYVFTRASQEVSFIGVLCALLFILHAPGDSIRMAVFFAASGIILMTSIIQDSYSMAFSDELTGLPSRRALRQEMMKLGMNYTIAMLDIDFFKKFNDKYGHDTGDDVLKLVASTIREVTGGGRAFRYGGEEFTILFPGKSICDAIPHLEELREKVSKRGFNLRSKGRSSSSAGSRSQGTKSSRQIHITISIGVSQRNDKNKTPDTVMKAADSALYRAKKKGRNCVSK